MECSNSCSTALTDAMQVVSGPVMCSSLSILRSWIITRVPRVR